MLSLITPDPSNFMKDFPVQNEINLDKIDAFAGPCLTSHPLRTYTPGLRGDITDPNVGAGTFTGVYYRIFDNIFVWAEFRFGSGFTVGSGPYTMTLPVAAKSIIAPTGAIGAAPIIGNGSVYDQSNSSGRQLVSVSLRSSTTVEFVIRIESGMAARNCAAENIPIVWATGDGITWCARYKCEA